MLKSHKKLTYVLSNIQPEADKAKINNFQTSSNYEGFRFRCKQDGHEETISPTESFTWRDRCSCATECNGQYKEKLTAGFRHQDPCDGTARTHSVNYKVTVTSVETGKTIQWKSAQLYTGMWVLSCALASVSCTILIHSS